VTNLSTHRRFFAEEIQVVANLNSEVLVDALATVPREQFLPPGPWTIRSEADLGGGPRLTPGADPRFVYHNVAVGIDPARMLFNGAPSVIGMAIDRLVLAPAQRVLHIGAGTGYFTALIAHCVGPRGRVLAIEVDEQLAGQSRLNVNEMPWIEVRHGNGSEPLTETFDAVLINAGVTHPLDTWIDALAPAGRLVMPLTATMPGMGSIGKGPMILVSKRGSGPDREDAPKDMERANALDADVRLDARIIGFVAIYSAVGLRDETLDGEIGRVLAKNPFPALKTLRRDNHERSTSCWLHASEWCLSLQ
jgi:protein-L-isoaspartate(D-aspartate) O-methyltransferase